VSRERACSQAYSLLALPLSLPDPTAWRSVCNGLWTDSLQEALEEAGVSVTLPPTMGGRMFEQAEKEYWQAFGLPDRLVRPVESVFKPWTADTTAKVPMANMKGWLGGDSAAHLRTLYGAVDISIPPAYSYAPDHLALELEFMAYLMEQGMIAQAELFRSQHLDWIGDLAAAAEAQGVPPFYRDLLSLTARFVACEASAVPA